MPTQAQLMAMNKEDLADAVDGAITKVKTYKEKAARAAEEMLEFVFAGLGASVAGWWLGSIQREIEDGTEGYDVDSLKLWGVDKDLGLGVLMGVGSQLGFGGKKFKAGLRAGAMGTLSFWAGRKSYKMAFEKDDDDDG